MKHLTLGSARNLVREVESRPALYSYNHPDFKNRLKYDAEWQSVALAFNTSVDVVINLWQRLRRSFSRCLLSRKRLQDGHKEIPHLSRFHLYDEMTFLLPYIHYKGDHGKMFRYEDYDKALQEILKTEIGDNVDSLDKETHYESRNMSSKVSCSSASSTISKKSRNNKIAASCSKKRRRNEEVRRISRNSGDVTCVDNDNSGSECSELKFFRGVVPMIQELPKIHKFRFYSEVTDLLFKRLDEQENDKS